MVPIGATAGVAVTGAADAEPVRLYVSGQRIAEGVADTSGAVTLRGRIPTTFREMRDRTVEVRGATGNRYGRSTISTVGPKVLAPTVREPVISRGSDQRVSVAGLMPHERVVVIYGGRWITPSGTRASAEGRYALTFDPGTTPGRRTVTVLGQGDARRGSVSFTLR